MIVGVGVDLIEISRVRQAYARWGERFLRRCFTPEERAYALQRRDPAPHLASRFAAKEAAAKALKTGIARGVGWKQIGVVRRRGEAPQLVLTLRAAALLEKLGPGVQVHLTLAHSRDLAQAVVVLEAPPA